MQWCGFLLFSLHCKSIPINPSHLPFHPNYVLVWAFWSLRPSQLHLLCRNTYLIVTAAQWKPQACQTGTSGRSSHAPPRCPPAVNAFLAQLPAGCDHCFQSKASAKQQAPTGPNQSPPRSTRVLNFHDFSLIIILKLIPRGWRFNKLMTQAMHEETWPLSV